MGSQDLGETYPVSPCPNCDMETYYHLVKKEGRRRLSLPLVGSVPIPTPQKIQFFLVCPHCDNSIRMRGSDVEEAKVILESTQRYINGEMSDERYGTRLQGFHEVLEDI